MTENAGWAKSLGLVAVILGFSAVVNLWGNSWGAPSYWHPDEIIGRSVRMFEKRSLFPWKFSYGHGHYYVVALGAVAPSHVAAKLGLISQEMTQAVTIQLARSLSGVMATLLVGLTFVIGWWLFNRQHGQVAAGLLALSMGFVTIAHFATVDTAANFWYWLACAASLGYWKRGGRAWLVGAGIAAGLAVGIKFDRALVIVPLVGAYLWRGERRPGVLWAALALLVIAFVLSNPVLLMRPFESMDGFTRDLWFNAMRQDPSRPRWQFFRYTVYGLGWPLTLLAVGGLAVMGWRLLLRRRQATAIAWVLSTFLPYVLLMGDRYVQPWYPVSIFPVLALAASLALLRMPRWSRALLATIVVIPTAAYMLGVVEQFGRDARYAAAAWIATHVPEGSCIECINVPPALDATRYTVVVHYPPHPIAGDVLRRMEQDPRYQQIRQAIAFLESWGTRIGLRARKRLYESWFDRIAIPVPPPAYQAAEPVHRPDYVLFMEHSSAPWLEAIQAEHSGYEAVARFEFVNAWLPEWLRVHRPMFHVNPSVYVFRRVNPVGDR